MSMKETQEDLVRQKLVLQELQRGSFPSLAVISQKMAEIFSTRIAGLPRFTYRPMYKGKSSSSADYNAMFAEMEEDLIACFEEARKLNNRIMALANYYESSRIRLDRDLKRIEAKAEHITHRAQAHVNRDIVGDTMSDFSKIEFKEIVHRNIPKTTAFIDLRYGEVHLNKSGGMTTKHDLHDAKVGFKTLTENSIVEHLTAPILALHDNIEDTWRSRIITQSAGGAKGQLDIILSAPITATNISIDTQAGRPMTITLFTSLDGETYVEYETRKVISSYQWVFERTTFQYIRFVMRKTEEDQTTGPDYIYLFGAKTIEVRDEEYLTQGYFVSKPFPLPNHEALQMIHLEADDYIPPGANIRYYVGMDYGDNVIEWQEISKNNPIDMKMVDTYRMEIDAFVDGYGDQIYTKYGHNYYRIAKLSHRPLAKSIQLLMGRHMWLKETIPATIDHPEDGTVYQTSIRDWIRAGSARKEYLNIDNYQDSLEKDTFQRYSTYVWMDEYTRYDGGIKVDEDASVAVFVNNNQVKSVNDQYQLQFKSGWNKIEILTYSRKEGQEITIGLYLREISDRIYANNQPLQQVSLYDLLNNTSIRLHNRFAVDDENNLIVNYNPREMDIRRHGIEYSLSFAYSVSEMTQHAIRFMAILSKEDPSMTATPRLKEYKLIIE